ncbi:MAG: TspO/MBR family protein [Alphaproteobacteria bacterium]|nr:TspO/MBR family protein [Alphaproteobacteria bacterium]
MKPSYAAVIAALWALGVLGTGGALTRLGPWYDSLVQPAWKPPDWAFGPAWTAIFVMSGLGFYLLLRALDAPARLRWSIGLFLLNGALNAGWSYLFFYSQDPRAALYEVGFLWLSIAALIVFSRKASATAALLHTPYLVWVAYAATLNWGVVDLNGL